MGHGCGRGRGADVALASQCSVQRLSRHPPHSVGRTQHACQPQQGEINCRWVSTVRTNTKTAVRTRAALPHSTLSLPFPFLRQRPLLLGCKVARGTGTRQVLVFSCPHRLLFLRSHVRLMGKGGVAWRGSFFFLILFSSSTIVDAMPLSRVHGDVLCVMVVVVGVCIPGLAVQSGDLLLLGVQGYCG